MTAELTVPLPKQPIEEPAAWRPGDLDSDAPWICRLENAGLQELEDAVDHVRDRGFTARRFERDDFPLPSLSRRIEGLIRELEHGRGCVLIKGLQVKRYGKADLKTLCRGLGVHLDIPISRNAKGELIGHLCDDGPDYRRENVRGGVAVKCRDYGDRRSRSGEAG